MDLTRLIVPKSDQVNSDNFLAGPQTFTITEEIEYEDPQQPAGLVLDGDTKHPYKPGKSMGRVLTSAWGTGSYIGRRLTLYTDPTVKFGGQEVGGIRISHMSHITKTLKFNLTEKKGSKKAFIVAPLADVKAPAKLANNSPEPTQPIRHEVIACTDVDALRAMWRISGAEIRALIQARIAELPASAADPEPAPTDDAEPSDADWDLINAGGAA